MADNLATSESKSAFYPSYAEFSKTLRTWFVAFGIGAPVVLLSNEKIWPTIVASGCAFDLGLLFLFGGGIQIISALVNKHAMWHMYFAEQSNENPNEIENNKSLQEEMLKKSRHGSTRIYRYSCWYSYQNWIDELLDFFTLVMFAWATGLAFVILSNSSGSISRDTFKSQLAWILGFFLMIIISMVWSHIYLKSPEKEPNCPPNTTGGEPEAHATRPLE